jgi:hypothetical protein
MARHLQSKSTQIRAFSIIGFFRWFAGKCNHRYILISSQVVVWPEGVFAHEPVFTAVLRRCERCGEHDYFRLLGQHEIGDLLRMNSTIEQLEEMAQR